MDYTGLFTELIKLSPFVASLFAFLFTVWQSLKKKDAVLMDTMKEHNVSMLSMQKESIMAQNNSADANRVLAESINQMRLHQAESQTELMSEIRGLRRVNGSPKKPVVPPAVA